MRLVFLTTKLCHTDEFTEPSLYVPLNAIAMEDILQKGLSFIKIEDYFDAKFAKTHKREIRACQQSILDRLDARLAEDLLDERIKQFGPNNLYCFVSFVQLDNYLLFFSILTKIIREYEPDQVFLNTERNTTYNCFFATPYEKYFFLLKTICSQHHITFNTIFNDNFSAGKTNDKDKRYIVLKIINKTILRVKLIVVSFPTVHIVLGRLLSLLKNEKIKSSEKREEPACFLQTGWGALYYEQFFKKPIFKNPIYWNNYSEGVERVDCNNLLPAIRTSIDQLNGLLGFDTSGIIHEVISRSRRIIEDSVQIAKKYCDYFETQQIRYVFYTNLNMEMLPAIMAANWIGLKTICKGHGASLFDDTKWSTSDLKPCRIYITEYNEFNDYLSAEARMFKYPTKCIVDSVRIVGKPRKQTKKLVYVPTLFCDRAITYDYSQMFSAEYFRIQVQILTVLNNSTKYRVIYKCLPGAPHYHYPVQSYIRTHFQNIAVSYMPIEYELGDCMCALIDCPSTPMFDAIGMNIPFHSLSLRKLDLRQSAVQLFDGFITFFESEKDVGDIVRSIVDKNNFHILERDKYGIKKKTKDELREIFKNL